MRFRPGFRPGTQAQFNGAKLKPRLTTGRMSAGVPESLMCWARRPGCAHPIQPCRAKLQPSRTPSEPAMALPHPAPRFDRQDYFAWETEQPVKHEYVAGEVFAQAGARQNHVVVAGNCFAALRQRLRGTPCRAYISDMQLEVAQADAVFYPDVMVSCHPEDLAAERVLHHPRVIVE